MIRLYCLTVAVMLSLGCNESRPLAPSVPLKKDSPVGQFDWAMQRLKRAVLDFRPSQRGGLWIGKQKISHELFPPDATRSHYTARVMIESETTYIHDQPLRGADREKKRQERLQREKTQRKIERSEFDDPLAEKFMEQMEDIAAEPRTPLAPEVTIKNPQASDRRVYDLAYLKGRWELQTEPEKEHERLWFEYALGVSPQDNSRRSQKRDRL